MYGVSMQKPDPTNSVESHGETFDKELKGKLQSFKDQGIQLVLVVLPSSKATTDARVKYWGDYQRGMLIFVPLDGNHWRTDSFA